MRWVVGSNLTIILTGLVCDESRFGGPCSNACLHNSRPLVKKRENVSRYLLAGASKMLFELCMCCLNYFSYVVLLAVIGCRLSRGFAYYTKQALISINLSLIALGMLLAGTCHSIYSTAVIAHKMIEPLLYWFELEYEVQAPEKFDKKRPYVVVMNHQHSLDTAAAAKVNCQTVSSYRSCANKRLGCWFSILGHPLFPFKN